MTSEAQLNHLRKLNSDPEHQSNAGKARAKWTNTHYSQLASKRMKEKNPGKLMHIKFKERDPEGYHKHQLKAGKKGGEINRQKFTDWEFFNKYGTLKSKYPYPEEFSKELKKMIFQRDGGICQICHKLIVNGHAIHHIDYNKRNNIPKNLILLCRACHNNTTIHRTYWSSYFKEMGLPEGFIETIETDDEIKLDRI